MIRPATGTDTEPCVEILAAWIAETPWMPRLHSPASMRAHWGRELRTKTAFVAEVDARVAGFAVLSDGFLSALYVASDARNKGVGGALLAAVLAVDPAPSLWVFQANKAAHRFYLRHDFQDVRRTEGDNEENLPDILMQRRAVSD